VREYINTPVDVLLTKKFKLDTHKIMLQDIGRDEQDYIVIKYKLTELFIAADRRLGKEKLTNWAIKKENPAVDKILVLRF